MQLALGLLVYRYTVLSQTYGRSHSYGYARMLDSGDCMNLWPVTCYSLGVIQSTTHRFRPSAPPPYTHDTLFLLDVLRMVYVYSPTIVICITYTHHYHTTKEWCYG